MKNPFGLTPPESARNLCGRDETKISLRNAGQNSGSRLYLVGPRRVGKTTLLNWLQNEIISQGGIVILSNFSTVLAESPESRVNSIFEASLRSAAKSCNVRWFKNLVNKHFGSDRLDINAAVNLGLVKIGTNRSSASKDASILRFLGDLNERLDMDNPPNVVVIIDEIQELSSPEDMGWSIRSVIQNHDKISYVFAGSDYSWAQLALSSKGGFFKMFKEVGITEVDRDTASTWASGFFTKLLAKAVDPSVIDVTFDFVETLADACLVWNELWQRVRAERLKSLSPADVEETFYLLVRQQRYTLEAFLRSLTENQRKVMALIALDRGKIYSEVVAEEVFGIKLTRGKIQSALLAVKKDGKVIEDKSRNCGFRLSSPFMARFLKSTIGL